MEPFCLIVVDGMFTITGRGFLVTPPLPVVKMTTMGFDVKPLVPAEMEGRTVCGGDHIELRRPGGSILPSIMEADHTKPIAGGSAFHLRLPKSVAPEDVPIGTEVWWTASGKK